MNSDCKNSILLFNNVENGDNNPLDDGYSYGTRLNTLNRAEGLNESCDTPTNNTMSDE